MFMHLLFEKNNYKAFEMPCPELFTAHVQEVELKKLTHTKMTRYSHNQLATSQGCSNLVTTMYKGGEVVTTMLLNCIVFATTLWQPGNNHVKRWEGCHNNVA